MKKQLFSGLMLILVLSFLSSSCKKDDDNGGSSGNQRKIKYELSGNYTGKILLVSSTNAGNLQQFNAIVLPWVKEIEYNAGVMAAGFGLQTDGNNIGTPGQTVSVKVYLNNQLKDTRSATADANGLVNMSLSFFTF